ncbi:hypothetical protein LX36DRAFT_697533 [Colletotrichum falcatum]|nr:hypothetical protein LX36DRAFT_697533 [Colletotrichum falcatum]
MVRRLRVPQMRDVRADREASTEEGGKKERAPSPKWQVNKKIPEPSMLQRRAFFVPQYRWDGKFESHKHAKAKSMPHHENRIGVPNRLAAGKQVVAASRRSGTDGKGPPWRGCGWSSRVRLVSITSAEATEAGVGIIADRVRGTIGGGVLPSWCDVLEMR